MRIRGKILGDNVPNIVRSGAKSYSNISEITFDREHFYIDQGTNNEEVIVSLDQTPGSDGSSGITFTDGEGGHSFENPTEVNFNPGYFYLTETTNSKPVVNLSDRFLGCIAIMDTNNSLSSGVGETLTFGSEIYDIGNWFDVGVSSSNFVVPANVYRIVVGGKITFTATGAPNAGSFHQVLILKNGANFPAGIATASRDAMIQVNNANMLHMFNSLPLPVFPGDIITVQALATFGGASDITVTAAQTYIGIYALNY